MTDTSTFKKQVKKRLRKTPQSSTDIARNMGLIGDEDTAGHYQVVKVRKALQELVKDGDAVHEGNKRTSVYMKAS
jgi:hypothetical protein